VALELQLRPFASFDPSLSLVFIERGVMQLPFSLQEYISTVQQLFRR